MSFFDEMETSVANTRLLQALDDKAPVNLKFTPFTDQKLQELDKTIQEKLTIEKLLKPNTIGSYQLSRFVEDFDLPAGQAYVEVNKYCRIDDADERRYEARGVVMACCVGFGVEVSSLPEEVPRPVKEVVDSKDSKVQDDDTTDSEVVPEPQVFELPEAKEALEAICAKIKAGSTPQNLFGKLTPYFLRAFQNKLDQFMGSSHYRRFVQAFDYMQKRQTIENFQIFRILGRGAFGAVSAARKSDTLAVFAIKEMAKKMVKKMDAATHVVNEKVVLSKMSSPFTLNLKYSFHDKDNLYLVFSMCTGGDLKFHLRQGINGRPKAFNNERARFYAAEILLGLEHMHSFSIVYRDLKPENVLLNDQGHCVISDMGLCIKYDPSRPNKHLAGTAGYWAPEVVSRSGATLASDWWSFGVMLYEFLTSRRPSCTCDLKSETDWSPFGLEPAHEHKAVRSPLNPKLNISYPSCVNNDAKDLLSKLFDPNPKTRLGANGAAEIKEHPYFKSIDFKALNQLLVKPPFKPDSNTVHANSIADVGKFSKSQFKEIKLTPEDEEFYIHHKFTYYNRKDTELEIVRAMYKADHQTIDPNDESPAGCCSVM